MILIALIVLVLDIVAIADIISSWKDTEKKVLWILLILILPLVGMLLYFLLGKKSGTQLLK